MERNPGWVLGRMLIASVFIVMGAWRLMARADGLAISGATLVFSTLELVLGLLIASGWRLRWTAALAAAAMLGRCRAFASVLDLRRRRARRAIAALHEEHCPDRRPAVAGRHRPPASTLSPR
jgi:hypothetical protein